MSHKRYVRAAHLWLALASSLPLVVLAVTGALLVFPDVTRRVTSSGDPPAPAADAPLRPSELIASAQAVLQGDDRINRLHYPRWPGDVLTVETRDRLITLDPSTGVVLRNVHADSDFVAFMTRLHVNLLAGEPGTWVTGVASLALLLLCVTGLWLWWPVGRWKRDYFAVRLSRGWRRFNFDLHRGSGLYFGALLFLVALTGATMAFWGAAAPLVYWVTASEPTRSAPGVTVEPAGRAASVTPDDALRIALDAYPGLEPRRLYLPAAPAKPYRVFLDPPGEHELRVREVRMEIDPYSGRILQAEAPETMSRGDRLLRWVLPLHFGTFGGTPMRVLYVLVSLSPVALVTTGTTLWLARRAKRRRAARLAAATSGRRGTT